MLGSLSRSRALAVARALGQRLAVAPAAQAQQCRALASAVNAATLDKPHDLFVDRHLGVSRPEEMQKMLDTIGYKSLEELIDATVPASIRMEKPLQLGEPRGEAELLAELKAMMDKNTIARSHIGAGYSDTITPHVILRNFMENPGWYTPYTPYQAEIAQGRLEMLLNFQTMISDLTGLPMANASLLDEGTAAAEAMTMFLYSAAKGKNVFLVSTNTHPQTVNVVRQRAKGFGVEVRLFTEGPEAEFADPSCQTVAGDNPVPLAEALKDDRVFGVLLQYPGTNGVIRKDMPELVKASAAAGARVVVASDILSLTLLTPPGEFGADAVVGSAQRFGVPMGFGGPHAAFLAVGEGFQRKLPGRVIGVSRDSRGKPALRMAMQTREQHIRRDKASSNICTAQALLANMAAAYAIYHGPAKLKEIASRVHANARLFAAGAQDLGLQVATASDFFDTVFVSTASPAQAEQLRAAAEAKNINIRTHGANVFVAMDEVTEPAHVQELLDIFGAALGSGKAVDVAAKAKAAGSIGVPAELQRQSPILTHPVFNSYHSETEMMRYLFRLQSKDLGLNTAMIPLGSCTMKLNAAAEMIPVTWPTVGRIHPYAPETQWQGYKEMLEGLEHDLCEVTGFDRISLQPNAGSQGEYAGLQAIISYHAAQGQAQRDVCLIPVSAHGTNPASAVMAGMKVVVVKCDAQGNIDLADLKVQAEKHKDRLAAIMVTYPSTHGVFEEGIKELCSLVHSYGGLVYMDGANMNAQLGLTRPRDMGADVCHLNLHKTFCIPHGGGGPGMGPIGVTAALAPYLPSHPQQAWGKSPVGPVSAAPYSSASILPIPWMFCRLMGSEGLTKAGKGAILAANYMAARLKDHFKIRYVGANGTCAHEFILDLRPFKASAGVTEEDVAKRLMDYNFHSPTMSWPVPGTLMVEPTESESLYELDRFCDAMISIREEIRDIEEGRADREVNLLKGAPHTHDMLTSDEWHGKYSREQAAYPQRYLRTQKYWPTVGRLDNIYGDRNVVCSCPPIESYQ